MIMKKNLAVSVILFSLSVVAPAAAAGDYGLGKVREQAGLPTSVAGAATILGIVGKVIAAGLSLLGIVFFLLVLYAGFIWMKARGSAEEVEQAKNIIEGAVIGLVLVSAAYAIANFVFTSLK